MFKTQGNIPKDYQCNRKDPLERRDFGSPI